MGIGGNIEEAGLDGLENKASSHPQSAQQMKGPDREGSLAVGLEEKVGRGTLGQDVCCVGGGERGPRGRSADSLARPLQERPERAGSGGSLRAWLWLEGHCPVPQRTKS